MGYYTDYTLTMKKASRDEATGETTYTDISDDVFDAIAKSVHVCLNAYRDDHFFDGYFMMWNERDTDMCRLSAKFPDILFELYGSGEAMLDIWKIYYFNGRAQHSQAYISFDAFDPSKLKG